MDGRSGIVRPNLLVTCCMCILLKSIESDVLHATVFGMSFVILDSAEAARDLLEKRSSIYSSRPRMPMLNEVCVGHYHYYVSRSHSSSCLIYYIGLGGTGPSQLSLMAMLGVPVVVFFKPNSTSNPPNGFILTRLYHAIECSCVC